MGRPRVNLRGMSVPDEARRKALREVRNGVVERDPGGLPIRVVWRHSDGELHCTVDMAFARSLPTLSSMIADFLAERYTTKSSPVTPPTTAEKLRYGLVAFLNQEGRRHLLPSDLDGTDHDAFRLFVARMDVSDAVKCHRWLGAAMFLKSCANARRLPAGEWSAHREGRANALVPEELQRVLAAAGSEALQTMERYYAQFDAAHPRWSVGADRPFLEVLFRLRAAFNGRFPNLPAIKAHDRDLWREVSKLGWYELRHWWEPTVENIGALQILWLWFFRLNPSMAQTMTRGQVGLVDGEWVVVKRKPRSGRRQTPGYPDGDEPLGPGRVRDFLLCWIDPVRHLAPAKLQSRLFLYTHAFGKGVAAVSDRTTNMRVFAAFRERHGISRLTAGMLRPTAIDRVGEATGDDIDFRRATGQHTAEINEKSYRSGDAELRRRVRIGLAQKVRRRDYRSHPVLTGAPRLDRERYGAATPGWTCAFPLDRRYSTAPPGELCNAVGRCPVCVLGSPDLTCGRSLANVLALLEAAKEEVLGGLPARIGVYAPVVDRLSTHWIPSFEQSAWDGLPDFVPSMRGCLS